jgi:hypothetical protein
LNTTLSRGEYYSLKVLDPTTKVISDRQYIERKSTNWSRQQTQINPQARDQGSLQTKDPVVLSLSTFLTSVPVPLTQSTTGNSSLAEGTPPLRDPKSTRRRTQDVRRTCQGRTGARRRGESGRPARSRPGSDCRLTMWVVLRLVLAEKDDRERNRREMWEKDKGIGTSWEGRDSS